MDKKRAKGCNKFHKNIKTTQAAIFDEDELVKEFVYPKEELNLSRARLAQKVKTARGRKVSSTSWLQRQLNDPYVQMAKAQNYRSRAAYKLKEIDEKFNLFKNAKNILDLGCAPGAWSQYCARKKFEEKSDDELAKKLNKGKKLLKREIIAIDLLDVDPVNETFPVKIIKGDFTSPDKQDEILNCLQGKNAEKFEVILSDMAPSITGNKKTDQLQNEYLVDIVIDFSLQYLVVGGKLLCKTFQGVTSKKQSSLLKNNFEYVKHVKPKSSRAKSAEYYLLAMGFKGDGFKKAKL